MITRERPPPAISNDLVHALGRAARMAAEAARRHVGRGDPTKVDAAAVEALHRALDEMPIRGVIVAGEGLADDAPHLPDGTEVGRGGPEMDLVVDPVDGTRQAAKGEPNAVTLLAMGPRGTLMPVPDVKMAKIVLPPGIDPEAFDLDAPVEDTLRLLAKLRKKPVYRLSIAVLASQRLGRLANRDGTILPVCRELGLDLQLTPNEWQHVVACGLDDGRVDAVLGVGGAPELVISAAALTHRKAGLLCRFWFDDDAQRHLVTQRGLSVERVYRLHDLVRGPAVFAMAGVTDGLVTAAGELRTFGTR